jgi:hypothetical protein
MSSKAALPTSRTTDPLSHPVVLADLLHRGQNAGLQDLLTGRPGGADLEDASSDDRQTVPTICAVEAGQPLDSEAAHRALLENVKGGQSTRWKRLQGALEQQQQGGGRYTALRCWSTPKGWLASAEEAIANFSWIEDPSRARVVATAADCPWISAAIAAARDDAFLPPGMRWPEESPVLLLEEIQSSVQFREVWVSPSATVEEMCRAAEIASVGLHVVRA